MFVVFIYYLSHQINKLDGGSGDDEILFICEEDINCRFGGKCVADGHHGYSCDCNKNCRAIRLVNKLQIIK